MKPLSGMHLLLLVLALVSITPVVEAEQSWGVFAIAASAAVLSCLYYRWSGSRCAPRAVLYLSVLTAVAYLIYEMFYDEETTVQIIDLSHFIIFLACCKFFELNSFRDAGLIALISFLLMVIGALVSASPLFGLAVLIDATVGVGWLVVFHTQREIHGVKARRRAALAGVVEAPSEDRADVEPLPLGGTVRLTAACSIVLAIITLIVFIFTPRDWQGGIFGRIRALVSVTGFNDVVQLTSNEIYEDDSPVMRVRFTRGEEILTDQSFQAYMRGLTFDRYYGRRWNRTPTKSSRRAEGGAVDSPAPILYSPYDLFSDHVIRQEVWLESLGSGILFSLFPPLAFGSQDINRIELDLEDHILRTRSSSRKAAHYTTYAPARLTHEWADIFSGNASRSRDGESNIPPRIRDFARDFVLPIGNPGNPDEHGYIATEIADFLRSNAFTYTLHRGGRPEHSDPIQDFLFNNRRGHCEYFASAMTLMCQAIGIRARLVSGYHGGEFNEAGGFFLFRKRDAHAWVEVFLQDRGWVIFDPTPSNTTQRRDHPSLMARIQQFMNLLQFKWSTMVVSFDATEREALSGGVRAWLTKLSQTDGQPKSFSAMVKALLWGPELPAAWLRILYWLLLALCATFVVLTMRVLWILSLMLREYLPARRHRHPRLVRSPEARFYDRMVLLLAHKGHIKAEHATPREFAASLATSHPDMADLPEFIEWFYEAQYGGKPLENHRWERIRAFLSRLREDPSFGVG
ncbi:MAG: DUF3488 and DUF4129 domain-containing transglutaminase family protein [Phycisphaerae bacterium]